MVREADAEAHEALSSTAQKVLRLYVGHADARGVALFTQKDTATKLALSRAAVQRALDELKKARFLVLVGYGCVAVDRQKVTTTWRSDEAGVEAHEFFERMREVALPAAERKKAGWRRRPPEAKPVAPAENKDAWMPKAEDVPY